MLDLKDQLLWCRRAQWALAAGLLLGVGVTYLAAIRPASLRLSVVAARATAQQAKLDVARARLQTLADVERDTQQLREVLERADKQLLQSGELPRVIAEVSQLGKDSLLRNVQWRADARPTRTQRFTELPVEFSFAGRFANVFQFLRQTEQMQRLTRVKRLSIHTGDSGDADPQVDAQLTMNLYFVDE
ncbi:MAG TPA: type 4a pilus biogenesis protein PilO [Tepidisphaeraceae bacterium]|nr:type 4a pilus biogenesis protein PilO [Tepidisphaeraceae bacterium]